MTENFWQARRDALINDIRGSLGDRTPEFELGSGASSDSNSVVDALERIDYGIKMIIWYESRKLLDFVFEEVKKIVIENEDDAEKQGYEVSHGGKFTLKLTLSDTSKMFDSNQIRGCLLSAGLKNHPEYRAQLLDAASWSVYNMKWTLEKEMWYQPPKTMVDLIQSKNLDGDLIKVFWNCYKINKRGRKQERGLAVARNKFYTFGEKGSRWHEYKYSEMASVDVHDVKRGETKGELKCTIWLNHEEEEHHFFAKFGKIKLPGVKLPGIKLPGVKLPGIKMPGISLPKVDLPKVDLPKVDLPDMPHIDLGFHRKPRPKRQHPATQCIPEGGKEWKDCFYMTFVCNHKTKEKEISHEDGNSLILEMAYLMYSAWRYNCGGIEEVFWTDKLQKGLRTVTEIEDMKPQEE